MAANALHIDVIVSDPAIRGGSPVIAGTGLRVIDLVAYHIYGDKLSPEELAEGFGISLGHVYAALAYYHLHQDELEAEIQKNDSEAQALLAELDAQGRVIHLD